MEALLGLLGVMALGIAIISFFRPIASISHKRTALLAITGLILLALNGALEENQERSVVAAQAPRYKSTTQAAISPQIAKAAAVADEKFVAMRQCLQTAPVRPEAQKYQDTIDGSLMDFCGPKVQSFGVYCSQLQIYVDTRVTDHVTTANFTIRHSGDCARIIDQERWQIRDARFPRALEPF